MFYPEKKDTAAATSKSVVLSNTKKLYKNKIVIIIIERIKDTISLERKKKSVNMGRIVNGIPSLYAF